MNSSEQGKENRSFGSWGEEMTVSFLQQKGYRILARNFHCRFGEVDIIAKYDNYVVFVEVKTRRSSSFACAREYVNAAKQRKLQSTALFWLAGHPGSLQPRFDVVEVYAAGENAEPQFQHIENAFC